MKSGLNFATAGSILSRHALRHREISDPEGVHLEAQQSIQTTVQRSCDLSMSIVKPFWHIQRCLSSWAKIIFLPNVSFFEVSGLASFPKDLHQHSS